MAAAVRLRLGAVLPVEAVRAGTVAITEFVQALESTGIDHLSVFDHVLGAVLTRRTPAVTAAYDHRTPFREPFVLFGYLSAVATRLELVTAVLALPQRQTALVAKQAAEVALLSQGRLRLGVGVGVNPVEFEGLGADFTTRGPRQEEQIALLRRLWNEDLVQFTGRWHRVDRAGIAPRPHHSIPLWMGGRAEVSLRRAARLADGLIGVVHDATDLTILARMRTLVQQAGRHDFGLDALIDRQADGDYTDLLRRLNDLGTTHVTVRTDGSGPDLADHLAAVQTFATAAQPGRLVLPRLRARTEPGQG